MHASTAKELVERAAADPADADLATVKAAYAAARRLVAWAESREALLARRLRGLSAYPERTMAEAANATMRSANRAQQRADTAEALPTFGEAYEAGEISSEHVDVIGKARRNLPEALQPALAARQEVRRIEADGGERRLERQKRERRFRTWIDRVTGVVHGHLSLDPESGLALLGRLDAAIASLFAEHTPEGCPSDPTEKQDFLRALALLALVDGRASHRGRPEVVVVVDLTQPEDTGEPAVDWGLPVELPLSVLRRFAGTADVSPVVLRRGVVFHTPGELNLGRDTRVANRAQRRVLRVLYQSCAVPGCEVRFEYCKIHHVTWWRQGGRTDLSNLLPLCERHHHAVHDDGWIVTVDADHRRLTVDLPDGTKLTGGPNFRRSPRADPADEAGEASDDDHAEPLTDDTS
jgi:hypothetical protein